MATANNDCFSIEDARKLVTDPRYIIDEFIGSGSMACVYKVHERGTPNIYALKLLREQYRQRANFVQIFRREADHMRDLQYPNIVRFYKFVEEEQSAYILMDFVEGKALTHDIRQARETGQPLPLEKIVRVMAQIARAISYLHNEGYIHRDIKPGNILLVGDNEQALLTDLGIAGAVDEPALGGAGTPSYMPYEQQVRGNVDRTVDIYAFAIMMFELFTGNKPFLPQPGLPFNEARKEMVELHRKQPVPSISSKRADLPEVMDAFFEQALAKKPADRYGDILDFVKDIHEELRPQLPANLQNFDTIRQQQEQNTSEKAQESSLDTRVIIGGIIAIAAIVIAMIFTLNAFSSAGPTPTPEPTVTLTPTSTATRTPEPTTQPTQEIIPEFELGQGIDVTSFGETLNSAISYIARIREGFVPLQIGRTMQDFRVTITWRESDTLQSGQYGIAIRQTDPDNYILFSVDGESSALQLVEVQNGNELILQETSIDGSFATDWIISVLNDQLTIEYGDITIEESLSSNRDGHIALWVPPSPQDVVQVESLVVALLGEGASIASSTGFERVPVNPQQFLIEDIIALQATVDSNAEANCIAFNEIYSRFDIHAEISINEEAVRELQQASTVIESECETSGDSSEVPLVFADYLAWKNAVERLLANIETP